MNRTQKKDELFWFIKRMKKVLSLFLLSFKDEYFEVLYQKKKILFFQTFESNSFFRSLPNRIWFYYFLVQFIMVICISHWIFKILCSKLRTLNWITQNSSNYFIRLFSSKLTHFGNKPDCEFDLCNKLNFIKLLFFS